MRKVGQKAGHDSNYSLFYRSTNCIIFSTAQPLLVHDSSQDETLVTAGLAVSTLESELLEYYGMGKRRTWINLRS